MAETPDVLTGDIIDTPSAEVAVPDNLPHAGAEAAIEAAAVAALENPGVASLEEFKSLCLQAKMLSMAEMAPKALRGKPYDTLMVLMTARELNIGATAAMRKVYVIDGQPSLAPQLEAALIRQRGLGSVIPHPDNSPVWAAAIPLGPDGEPMGDAVAYDWDDALDAELVDHTCHVDWQERRVTHNIRSITKKGKNGTYTVQGCQCKDNYRKSGRDMLYWRAVGRCTRFYFPEVGLGLYSPDELGALMDTDGTPVTPDTVEPPPGYEIERRASTADKATDEQLTEMRARLVAMPDKKWRERATELRHQAGLPQADEMTRGQARQALGIIKGIEADIRKEVPGYTYPPPETPAPQEAAQEPPEAPAAPTEPAEVPATEGEAPGAESGDGEVADEAPAEQEKPEVAPEDEPRAVAEAMQQFIRGVPDAIVTEVAAEVKALHHSKVNSELARLGGAVSGHIDVRRMRLTARLAKQQWLESEHRADRVHERAGCPLCEEPF